MIETAGWEFRTAVKFLAAGLGSQRDLVGDGLTVADIVAGHTLSWAKSARLSFRREHLERYLDSLLARDAARRALERTQTSSSIISSTR